MLLLRDRSDPRRQDRYWLGADLVVEVVSPDDPGRDLIEKRADYAEGGIPEYWIVDPRDETITVLALKDGAYVEHGVFTRGAAALSALLEGFAGPTCPKCSTPRSRAVDRWLTPSGPAVRSSPSTQQLTFANGHSIGIHANRGCRSPMTGSLGYKLTQ